MIGMEFKCFRVNQYSPPKRAENCVEIPEIFLYTFVGKVTIKMGLHFLQN